MSYVRSIYVLYPGGYWSVVKYYVKNVRLKLCKIYLYKKRYYNVKNREQFALADMFDQNRKNVKVKITIKEKMLK